MNAVNDGSTFQALQPPPPPAKVLRGHTADVMTLAFVGSDYLASGDAGGNLRLWRVSEAESVAQVLGTHFGLGLVSVRISRQDASKLLSQGRDGSLREWDLSRGGGLTGGHEIVSNLGLNFCRFDLQFSKGGPLIAAAGGDRSENIVIVTDSGDLVTTLSSGERSWGMCTSVAFLDHDYVVGGYEDGSVRLWDLRMNSVCSEVHERDQPIFALAVHPTDNILFSAGATSDITAVRIQSSSMEIQNRRSLPTSGVSQLCFRPDGRILAVACWDGRLRIYGSKHGKCGFLRPLASLSYHNAILHCVASSLSQISFASSGGDKRIALWRVYPFPTQTREDGR